MINRILIRIKVVQMLYSYLLTRSEFKIEEMPVDASRDKKYAYSLYFDLILFILILSGYNIHNDNSKCHLDALSNSKLAKALISNEELRNNSLFKRNIANFDSILPSIYKIIISSSAFKDYSKISSPEIKDDVIFWNIILRTIILKNESFINEARQNSAFTVKGFELGVQMVIDTFNSYSETRTSLKDAQKALSKALNKSYELYFYVFELIVELTQMQTKRLDAAKTKYLPSDEDLNPNTRFIDNQLVKFIESNDDFKNYISSNPISWNDDTLFLKSLLDKILTSDIYANYMSSTYSDCKSDCDFWKNILKTIVFNDEDFLNILEEKSSYWNDDLHIIGTFVIKTIKQFSNSTNANLSLIPQYKNIDDENFGPCLFADTITNFEIYRAYIDKFISEQWDSERLAFMDIIIMSVAISEMLIFPSIPLPVTLNEYIEIANSYSTSKSGQFINGILYSVINYLKSEGKLNK